MHLRRNLSLHQPQQGKYPIPENGNYGKPFQPLHRLGEQSWWQRCTTSSCRTIGWGNYFWCYLSFRWTAKSKIFYRTRQILSWRLPSSEIYKDNCSRLQVGHFVLKILNVELSRSQYVIYPSWATDWHWTRTGSEVICGSLSMFDSPVAVPKKYHWWRLWVSQVSVPRWSNCKVSNISFKIRSKCICSSLNSHTFFWPGCLAWTVRWRKR